MPQLGTGAVDWGSKGNVRCLREWGPIDSRRSFSPENWELLAPFRSPLKEHLGEHSAKAPSTPLEGSRTSEALSDFPLSACPKYPLLRQRKQARMASQIAYEWRCPSERAA